MGCQDVCYDRSLQALQNQLESKENVSPVCLRLMMPHQSTVLRQQSIFSADISAVHNRKCTGIKSMMAQLPFLSQLNNGCEPAWTAARQYRNTPHLNFLHWYVNLSAVNFAQTNFAPRRRKFRLVCQICGSSLLVSVSSCLWPENWSQFDPLKQVSVPKMILNLRNCSCSQLLRMKGLTH